MCCTHQSFRAPSRVLPPSAHLASSYSQSVARQSVPRYQRHLKGHAQGIGSPFALNSNRLSSCRQLTKSRAAGETNVLPASRLIQVYCVLQHPAYSNTRYSKAVMDFVNECVLAYECGISESDLTNSIREAAEAQQKSLPNAMQDFTEQGFLHCVVIIWVTLMLSPKGVVTRWSNSPAVSDESLKSWKGFVSMIVNAYFEKRMAWYPLDRLGLELTAVQGSSPTQDVVAERARLVFTTLERISPQFPSDG